MNLTEEELKAIQKEAEEAKHTFITNTFFKQHPGLLFYHQGYFNALKEERIKAKKLLEALYHIKVWAGDEPALVTKWAEIAINEYNKNS